MATSRRPGVWMERIGATPLTLAVFAGSALLLLFLRTAGFGTLRAKGVAHAPRVEHPASVATVVEELHVRAGDVVDAGAPLASLSPRFLQRELADVEAEIEALAREAHLEQVRLQDQERQTDLSVRDRVGRARAESVRAQALQERQAAVVQSIERQLEDVTRRAEARVAPAEELREAGRLLERERAQAIEASRIVETEVRRLRELEQALGRAPGLSPLAAPTADLFDARLAALRQRRLALLDDLKGLTVTARAHGRVVATVSAGSGVAPGSSVVTLVPERATELVAYVPSDTRPASVVPGAALRLTEPRGACDRPLVVARTGGAVEEAPGQLHGPLRVPLFGLPVYATLPDDCALAVGAVVAVELLQP